MSQAQLLPTEHFSPSVSLIEGRPATTSLAIAQHFGKRHDHVMRDIRKLCAELPDAVRTPNFGETSRTVAGPNNSERQEEFFIVYFDGFILLVMGYTGKKALQIKLLYIAAFNAMRDELAAQREAALPEVPHIKITPSTTASRKPLRALVHAWAQVSGTPHTALWPQVKAHFQLERIDDLPEEWIPDALEWVQGKIDSLPPALPPTDKESLTVAAPTSLPFRADFPADMSDGCKDALERIQRLAWGVHAALDVVRLGCYPGPKTMKLSREQRETYNARFALYSVAADSLVAAYNALEAGYKLDRLHGRG